MEDKRNAPGNFFEQGGIVDVALDKGNAGCVTKKLNGFTAVADKQDRWFVGLLQRFGESVTNCAGAADDEIFADHWSVPSGLIAWHLGAGEMAIRCANPFWIDRTRLEFDGSRKLLGRTKKGGPKPTLIAARSRLFMSEFGFETHRNEGLTWLVNHQRAL